MKNRNSFFSRWAVAAGCGWLLAGLFTYARTDAASATAPTASAGVCAPHLTPSFLPAGTKGKPYFVQLSAICTLAPYYQVTSGFLPPGLTLSSNGALAGVPAAAGTYNFTIHGLGGYAGNAVRSYSLIIRERAASALAATNDFDGDGKTDISVWRAQARDWTILNSGDGSFRGVPWGEQFHPQRDVIVSGDFDGDGRSDPAVFRTTDGHWGILGSGDGTFTDTPLGTGTDRGTDFPVPADYDGDGKTDLALFGEGDGSWQVLRSSDNRVVFFTWGAAGDLPVVADYDGDGKADPAVFRPFDGSWYVLRSSDNRLMTNVWGNAADTPVPADYDGDGKADFAVWREKDKTWYIKHSSDNSAHADKWEKAKAGDVPVAGDYDGDGKSDKALWHGPEGKWNIKRSSDKQEYSKVHGSSGDKPVPGKKMK